MPKLDDRVPGAPVPLRGDAARIVSGLDHFLATLRLQIPGVRPTACDVMPERDLTKEALTLFRSLSDILRGGGGGAAKHSVFSWT